MACVIDYGRVTTLHARRYFLIQVRGAGGPLSDEISWHCFFVFGRLNDSKETSGGETKQDTVEMNIT